MVIENVPHGDHKLTFARLVQQALGCPMVCSGASFAIQLYLHQHIAYTVCFGMVSFLCVDCVARLLRSCAQTSCGVYLAVQTHAQLPLVEEGDRSQETKRVHVYSSNWALQADGYEPVAFDAPLTK